MSTSVYRILDANFNRAREAIRVVEEFARFALNDRGLTEAAKRMRHDLVAVRKSLPDADLLTARDTPGDVGTQVSTPGETDRQSPAEVVAAATSRLTEALRTLEEYGKTIAPEFGRAIEALRYRAYDLEKRIRLRACPNRRFADVRLYVLITEALCRNDWLRTAEDALAGGADCLQLREKDLDDSQFLDRAGALADLCHEREKVCIINDRPDVAVLAGADGVHLGQDDLPVAAARQIVGPDFLIGLSTHSLDQARAAVAVGPDYIGVGPMFESATKARPTLAGPQTLKRVLDEIRLPHVAVGGITPDNVDQLIAVGCKAVAVCQAVIAAEAPKAAAEKIKARLT